MKEVFLAMTEIRKVASAGGITRLGLSLASLVSFLDNPPLACQPMGCYLQSSGESVKLLSWERWSSAAA